MTYTINTITVQPADVVTPYTIISAVANKTQQEQNPAKHSIDASYDTKYAANDGCDIVWDIGNVQELGFISLSFMGDSNRKQYFKLEVSADDRGI